MTDIFYLTADRYHEYNPNLPPGTKNPGGGISDKTICVLDAWRKFYDVGVGENIEDAHDADFLVVEPLWFRLRGGLEGLLKSPDLEEAVKAYEDHPAKRKIVYCSEFGFIKLPKVHRGRIIEASSVVTTNCDYQEQVFSAVGIETVRLCDPVDESVFYNDVPKTLSVVAAGLISPFKNSRKIIEIFQILGEYSDIERIYIGDSTLWGATDFKDLEDEMRASVDMFHPNMNQVSLAQTLGPISCGIMDTIHDSCSAMNIIMCMGGILCFYGRHGAWRGRPGIKELETADDFVVAIELATESFASVPESHNFDEARAWAMANYSQARFLEDWVEVRKHVNG